VGAAGERTHLVDGAEPFCGEERAGDARAMVLHDAESRRTPGVVANARDDRLAPGERAQPFGEGAGLRRADEHAQVAAGAAARRAGAEGPLGGGRGHLVEAVEDGARPARRRKNTLLLGGESQGEEAGRGVDRDSIRCMSSPPPILAGMPAALRREEVAALYRRPLLDLVRDAAEVHRRHHDPAEVQCSSLLSIKTGGCPEDCGYCSQSAHHDAGLRREPLLEIDEVVERAKAARAAGADRFCMGAAWREVRDGPEFEQVLAMVRSVRELGLETCATLGMLTCGQAARLKEAGLDYYNHNLDTSREFYDSVVTTRRYDDRLRTLDAVRNAGMKVCCGGILGMGESEEDRIGLLHELARRDPPIESVPINALVAVPGTPLADRPPLPWDEMVRAVAVARILMPRAKVRLSAGRLILSEEAQALCFLAGANSIFLGERLLTTPNPLPDKDGALLGKLGLRPAGAGAR